MPHITIEASTISKDKKDELIRSVTKTASEVTEIPETSFTIVIKEFPMENWGVGGKPLAEVLKHD